MIRIEDEYYQLNEMARVGCTENNLEIVVWTNDGGNVPHFHIRDLNKGKNNEGCIKIQEAEYFPHGGKYEMRLNSKQRKELVSFLETKYPGKKFIGTYWEYLVMLWNDNNSKMLIDEDQPMPDYRNLPDKS